MAPSATVVFPTRARRDYLAVALASVAPQAAAAGAEVIVVEDDPEHPETRALAAAHGARYVAHGDTRGLNAARNTGIANAKADLIAFLDDDVEVWPGWLDELIEGAREHPAHGVLGGPIRARLEGTNLHACGREAPPITALDLGAEDRDADFAWGANFSVRRSTIERYGGFDASLDLYGDEEDWQRRYRAAGGRIRYLARAGVDHRRTGADARIRGLARAAYHRGRHSRRYDMRKGTSPSLPRELLVLAGSAAHVFRYRCGNGIVLTAHTAGRIAEALDPVRPSLAGQPEWVSGESGTLSRRTAFTGMVRDAATELAFLPRRLALIRAARTLSPRRVLAISVARPERAGSAAAAGQELERSHHKVDFRLAPVHPGAGKWENLNRALKVNELAGHDWLLIVDDDVVLPHRFLDCFLFLCERYAFTLAQPAHKHWSNAAWRVTRRRAGSVARRTRFVEIGPVTAIHSRAFADLLPFPDLHMGWGLDAHWGALAEEREWNVGVVDATPVRHTRPVAGDYPRERALDEAERFLATRPYITRAQAQETVTVYRSWKPAEGLPRPERDRPRGA
jgi:GT2 family glycosyltransferase